MAKEKEMTIEEADEIVGYMEVRSSVPLPVEWKKIVAAAKLIGKKAGAEEERSKHEITLQNYEGFLSRMRRIGVDSREIELIEKQMNIWKRDINN